MQEQAEKFDIELKRLEAKGYQANAAIYESQIKDKETVMQVIFCLRCNPAQMKLALVCLRKSEISGKTPVLHGTLFLLIQIR